MGITKKYSDSGISSGISAEEHSKGVNRLSEDHKQLEERLEKKNRNRWTKTMIVSLISLVIALVALMVAILSICGDGGEVAEKVGILGDGAALYPLYQL